MPKLHYDKTTKNDSFIKMRNYLKSIGIVNNKFMLGIYNKSLIGVNPYDPDLTPSQKIDIIKECMDNIWYYLREVVRIPNEDGTTSSFELDRANCAQIFCTFAGLNSWVAKPKQLHKTTDSCILCNYTRIFYGFADENDFQRIRLVSRNRNDQRFLKERMKKLTDCLPKYIQQIDCDKYKCVNSETPAGLFREKNKACNIARAFTDTMILFSDAEYINNIDILFSNSYPAFKTAQSVAIGKGIISCMLFESVINDIDNGQIFILNNSLKWNDKFYDFTTYDLLEYANNSSSNGIIYIENSYQELGKDDNWFKQQCKALANNIEYIRRELLLKRKDKEE